MRTTWLIKTQIFRSSQFVAEARARVPSYKAKYNHFHDQGTDELLLLSKFKRARNRRGGEGSGIGGGGRRRRGGTGRGRVGRDHIQLKNKEMPLGGGSICHGL